MDRDRDESVRRRNLERLMHLLREFLEENFTDVEVQNLIDRIEYVMGEMHRLRESVFNMANTGGNKDWRRRYD